MRRDQIAEEEIWQIPAIQNLAVTKQGPLRRGNVSPSLPGMWACTSPVMR